MLEVDEVVLEHGIRPFVTVARPKEHPLNAGQTRPFSSASTVIARLCSIAPPWPAPSATAVTTIRRLRHRG